MVTMLQLSDNSKSYNQQWGVIYKVKTDELIVAETHDKEVTITNMSKTGTWGPQTPVKVDCTCSDFKFRWAYVLWKHNSLLYPDKYLLEPPKHKNPGMIVGACKHISYVVRDFLGLGKENEKT